MNFTRMIKEELASVKYPSACCKEACLSAFLRCAGTVFVRGGNVGFSFSTESALTAGFFDGIIKSTFAEEGKTTTLSGGRDKIVCEYVSDTTLGVLAELGLVTVSASGVDVVMGIDRYVVDAECCKRAYVAGAFLGGGSCTVPTDEGAKNTGYHMEFVFSYYETAHAFAEILADFDIIAKLIKRKNTFVVYLKNNDELQEVLSLTGAENSSLFLAETVVKKDYNNKVNRKLNCDLSNISKQVAAAGRQIEAIGIISSTIGLDSLRPELKEVSLLRLSDDLLTLDEMAKTLGVTKSCVNHRLRKIMEIASEIKN